MHIPPAKHIMDVKDKVYVGLLARGHWLSEKGLEVLGPQKNSLDILAPWLLYFW